MYKLWQKKLGLKYPKNVMDIVQFGSSLMESTEPNDIDVAVIFNNIPIREQLLISQDIKEQLEKKINLPIHIKPYDIYTFFDPGNFARQNILYSGISILSGEYFSRRFGLDPVTHIYYSLLDMNKKDKIRINYLLSGKMGRYGLLREHNGRLLKPGLVAVSPESEHIFVDALKKSKVDFHLEKTFVLQNE